MIEKHYTQNSMLRVVSSRDFRLLFSGSATSLLGDQFTLIATPWLVLQLTGDPLALGIVLALAGIPRALFMLIGGAITDRFSPRRVMFIADVIRLILITWMQTRAPKEMLGRVMSLLMFSSTGSIPVSQAISGAVSKWSLNVLLITSGTMALLVTLWMTLQPSFKTFSESLSSPRTGSGEPRMNSVASH